MQKAQDKALPLYMSMAQVAPAAGIPVVAAGIPVVTPGATARHPLS